MKLKSIFFFCLFSFSLALNLGKSSTAKESSSKLDINHASRGEIAVKINPLAGKDLCHVITQYREKNGPFESVEALRKVKGIDEKTFELIKEHVTAVVLKE